MIPQVTALNYLWRNKPQWIFFLFTVWSNYGPFCPAAKGCGLHHMPHFFWMYYSALAMNKSICYNQTQEADQRNHDLALARIATSLICLLLTFPILALVCAHQLFKTATQRQYLYLVLATQAYLLTLAAGVDKIFTEYATHDHVCAALGFLTQWASITELFFTFSVIVFLQLAILRKHVDLAPHFCRDRLRGKQLLALEVMFVLLSIVSPPLLDWLPFREQRYGLSGAWCWIMSLDSVENCTDVGFEYQLILNYVPTAFISFTAVILTFVTKCHAVFKHRGTSYHHCKRAKEVALLLLCIILSSSLIIPEIITRTLIKQNNSVNVPYIIFMLYSVGTPLGRLVLCFDLFVYQDFISKEPMLRPCLSNMCRRMKHKHQRMHGSIEY